MKIQHLETITHNFAKELELSTTQKTSLPFIKHQLSLAPKVKEDEVFQVLRIGGSIYQNALVKRVNGKIVIVKSTQKALPVFATKEIFLTFIEKVANKETDHLAINFAYPMDPFNRNGYLDGRLVKGTKEHTFAGLMGELVGETIEKHIFDKQKRTIHVALANDTVCLLLSGLNQFKSEGLVGGIVGTGLNFAVFLDENTIVNLESAAFDKFTQSPEGKLIDKASVSPKYALFEKETSGGYLYQHFNIRLHKEGLDFPDVKSTKEMDAVAFKNIPLVSLLAREVSDHSSSLVSCQIAGIAKFLKRDCVFVIEGSLFWKGWRYKENVGITVRQLVPEQQISFVYVEESGVLGAAKLIS